MYLPRSNKCFKMSDILSRTILIVYMLSICVLTSDCEDLPEGSACELRGIPGICEKIANCEVASTAIKNKHHHDLRRCSFDGKLEIVCCPDLSDRIKHVVTTTTEAAFTFSGDSDKTTTSSPNKGKRKSEKMCEKIQTENKIPVEIGFNIYKGKNASVGEFPHAVALGLLNSNDQIEWNCGASLISEKFLLTAAHCFICQGCELKTARLGIIDITKSDDAQDIEIKRTIAHPKYDTTTKLNDIGLIELVKEVNMSNLVFPACLYTKTDDPMSLQIVGWGQTVASDFDSKSRLLQFGVIQPVPLTECNQTIVSQAQNSLKVIRDTQICGTTESDACPGDSGGPLQILQEKGYDIVGVVSFGASCGSKIPGVYTRVSRYLDWIEQIVWPD